MGKNVTVTSIICLRRDVVYMRSVFWFKKKKRDSEKCGVVTSMFFFNLSDELVKVHKMKPTQKWKEKFDSYLSTMPNYYAGVCTVRDRSKLAGNAFLELHGTLKEHKRNAKWNAKGTHSKFLGKVALEITEN